MPNFGHLGLGQLHHILDAVADIDETDAVVLQAGRREGRELFDGRPMMSRFVGKTGKDDPRLICHETRLTFRRVKEKVPGGILQGCRMAGKGWAALGQVRYDGKAVGEGCAGVAVEPEALMQMAIDAARLGMRKGQTPFGWVISRA